MHMHCSTNKQRNRDTGCACISQSKSNAISAYLEMSFVVQ